MYNIPRSDPAYSFYEDGYSTGQRWHLHSNHDYRPGGPYCCRDKRKYPDMYATDLLNSNEWFRGFDKGLQSIAVFNKLSRT